MMMARARAEQADSFGRVVDDYERGRPTYPSEAVRWLLEHAGRALEVGAGTGKLTRSVVALVPEMAAIEPQESMANQLSRSVPAARAVCARAEALPIASGWAEVVVVAQAFHWFDQSRAVPEMARVLRPGGRLALVWNVRDESVDWVAELSRIAGRDNSEETRRGLGLVEGFGPFETRVFRTVQELDVDSLVAHVCSRSNVASLPEPERVNVVRAVRHLCDAHADLAGKGRFELPYVTEAYRAPKL
jgi:SAM-dependent methyltransferase